MTETRELYENVIKGNYCIGCGACASIKNSPFKIKMDEYGNIVAYPAGDLDSNETPVLEICPFSGKSKNEDQLSDIIFESVKNKDPRIGKYIKCFAGFVNDEQFRSKGSSGGVGKWLGYTLLNENKIDYLVQVAANQSKDPSKPLFDYTILSNKDQVLQGSKSSYYPVSLADILDRIKSLNGSFAITGVPCFIKTIRLLTLKDDDLKSKIKYTIGIICGGMKSANQSKIIAWQLGVEPDNLVKIDFRRKHEDKPASYKIYQVWSDKDNVERYKDSYDIFGTGWSGYFSPNACNFCDDVVSETADISIGDAWLDKYIDDSKGTTIMVVRNPEILEIINKNIENRALILDEVTAEDVAESQAGGLRQRREALSYRISKKEGKNEWYPEKRVKAGDYNISNKRKKIYSLREKIAEQSHISAYKALHNNELNIFLKEMKPLAGKYRVEIYGSFPRRIYRKIKGYILKLLMQNK